MPYDNTLIETINGLCKAERTHTTAFRDGSYKTLADVAYATAGWVDWDNNRRLYFTLGMIHWYERAHYAALSPKPQPARER